MKKIGILTTFDELNPGAFLQAHSLFKLLKYNGYSPVLLHYKSLNYLFKELSIYFNLKKPTEWKYNIEKYFKFQSSLKYIEKSPLILSLRRLHNYLKRKKINTIVLGSDEIWNFKNAIGANIPAFWGYGLERYNLYTYAVSFGSITFEDEFPDYVLKGIKKIKAFLVRDENTQLILKKKFNITSKLVLDPTFLWNDFENIYQGKKLFKDNYSNNCWIVYGSFNTKLGYAILKTAKKFNAKVLSVFYRNLWCPYNLISISPFEWVDLLKQSSLIITNMYHGVIFSLKYKKSVIIKIDPYRKNKLQTLINLFDLKDNLINDAEEIEEIIKKIWYNKKKLNEFDYKISKLKNHSLNLLLTILKKDNIKSTTNEDTNNWD